MTRHFTFLLFILLSLGISCDDDVNNFDPSRDPLKGKIGGEDWNFGSGNASYVFFTGGYSGLIISDEPDDPCSIVAETTTHIEVKFPAQRGNYNLPYINNSGNTADVVFDLPGGKQYTATSGFLEIVQITSTEIVGYISADFDDNNYVEGAFLLRICD